MNTLYSHCNPPQCKIIKAKTITVRLGLGLDAGSPSPLTIWEFSLFSFLVFLQDFIVPCGKCRLPYLGKAKQVRGQCYSFLLVSVVFSCVQTMVWLSLSGIFNVHTDDDAHGECMDTVRESALEADLGRKIPCHTGDSNPHQYCGWFFQSDPLPSELSLPLLVHVLCRDSFEPVKQLQSSLLNSFFDPA